MIYVMSDIHGMYDQYRQMLDIIKFSKDDILYIIGDVVDRGSDSIRILKDMMLRDNVYGIIGNHELMAIRCLKWINKEITEEFIDSLDEDKVTELYNWLYNGGEQTLKQFQLLDNEDKEAIIEYILEFNLYEEITVNHKNYLLVHAGLGHYHKDKLLEDYSVEELVWDRVDLDITYNKHDAIIVGHTPTLSFHGQPKIYHHHPYIVIDCGACYDGGQLACLCLDTMEEYYI